MNNFFIDTSLNWTPYLHDEFAYVLLDKGNTTTRCTPNKLLYSLEVPGMGNITELNHARQTYVRLGSDRGLPNTSTVSEPLGQ
jgi:hypothetical protein